MLWLLGDSVLPQPFNIFDINSQDDPCPWSPEGGHLVPKEKVSPSPFGLWTSNLGLTTNKTIIAGLVFSSSQGDDELSPSSHILLIGWPLSAPGVFPCQSHQTPGYWQLTYEGHITVSGWSLNSGEDRQHFLPVMIGDSGEAGVRYILCLRNMDMVIYVPIGVFFFQYLF